MLSDLYFFGGSECVDSEIWVIIKNSTQRNVCGDGKTGNRIDSLSAENWNWWRIESGIDLWTGCLILTFMAKPNEMQFRSGVFVEQINDST